MAERAAGDDKDPTLEVEVSRPPERLGPCRMLGQIGSGGMASVYLGELVEERHYAPVGTRVAVKVLDREGSFVADAVARFHREADVGTRLVHPGIVRTHEAGSAQVGDRRLHFLVLEYVEGRSLEHLMGDLGVIPEPLLRAIAAQAAAALAVIHAAGIVHRDLKPSNVLLTSEHVVKVADLGLAVLVDDQAHLTRSGLFVGTLSYASPEQLGGRGVGPASDLYSLGVVLLEAATGMNPFVGGVVEAIMHRHMELVPPRAGQLNPQVSPLLEETIAALLDKVPERRLGAAELASLMELGEGSEWWRNREVTVRSAHPRAGLPAARVPRETRVIGREVELGALDGQFLEAKAGRGRTVLLEGEAGVGKTRLLDEFVRRLAQAREAVHVLYGSHPPGTRMRAGGTLAGAVVAYFGEAQLASRLAPYLTATPRLVPAFAAYLAGTPAPPSADPLTAEALTTVFGNLARGLAEERVVIWLVEDLHFASADSHALLLALARIAHDHRLLLVATSRHAFASEEWAQLERQGSARRLGLDRLSPRDVIHLLSEALRSEALADRLGGRIAAKSDGNPFFIFEMLGELREKHSLLQLPDGSYAATNEAERLQVPSTVRDLLLGYLRELPGPDRALLDVAAVQGFDFDPDLIARVRDVRRLHVLEALAGIERRTRFVRATGAGFQFQHHQLQEVIYEALPPLLRAEYHALLAEAYQTRGGFSSKSPAEIPGDAAVFLAGHSLRGGREQAGLRYILRALDHLASRYQNESLLELAELALVALGPGDQALRCDVRLHQAECLDLLGRRDAQQAVVDEAVAAARETGDSGRLARALLARGGFLYHVADYAAALAALEDAVGRASASQAIETEARATGLIGSILRAIGRHATAEPLAEHSLALFRQAGDRAGEAQALFDVAALAIWEGRFSDAQAALEPCLALTRALGLKRLESIALGSLGLLAWAAGDYATGHKRYQDYARLARDAGFLHGELVALGSLATILTDEGHFEAAEKSLERATELVAVLRHKHLAAYVLLNQGHLARARRAPASAREHYAQALALARGLGLGASLAEFLFALGRERFEAGDRDGAAALLLEAEEVSRGLIAAVGTLPAAYLALLGQRDPRTVEVSGRTHAIARAEAHLTLHMAGAGGEHLARARGLLEQICRHLNEGDCEQFWRRNPTARGVRDAEAKGDGGGGTLSA